MWINLTVFCLCYLSSGKTYFSPFNNIMSAMPFLAVLLITLAFLAVAAGRWKGSTGLIKLVRSLSDNASD
jgi:hypothetical protein